ncbi:MAG: M48 family metallopeptidase [Chloroflexi bacterium]|nr:M48 family metallopeptidase [Chloroflexota bacterium]
MTTPAKIIRSRRKSIALVVQPDGELIIRAPKRATRKQIDNLIEKHTNWIAKKQMQAKETQALFAPHLFREGESFPFLGKDYPLEFIDLEKPKLNLEKTFQLAKSSQGQAEKVFEQWYKKQAREIFAERVTHYAQKHGFSYKKVKLSSAKKRWGSCSAKGNLNLTWRLVMMPIEIIDYVVVHELCHLRELNHSKAFWAEVERILPDYKVRRKWLKEKGNKFHFP